MTRLVSLWLVGGFLLGFGACRRDPDAVPTDHAGEAEEEQQAELLVFPDDLRVDEPGVNAFVRQAMTECAGGDYELFRLLWSVREEPLSRDEYEQGWQAVRQIRIRALQKVILAADSRGQPADGETAYAILADVDFDPTHRAARGQPHREVVLMIRREHGEWRLTYTPKALRPWIKKRFGGVPSPLTQSVKD